MKIKVVDIMIKQIEDKLGNMTVTMGDHVSVGVDTKFLDNGRV